ncbi:uncharacterized protein STEHIDRAFT_71828 [Stereum hirsutum FP-91666 SS1]|uniref:uncharacterized protein n=1 Tax=Stereum hirsutum (strain FP-91666) TaxID=721885 RepID=UPI000440BAB3|nr:uncharacterized protein STEHIDRAFT_71828 [Stereum hirsutum FP-91666 SS1]EIM92769.1 hypothetical protein STEHIDRAFT_71828 [Stereum hirsutum FP-91666 SS1]
MLGNIIFALRHLRASADIWKTSTYTTSVAALRYLTARQYHVPFFGWYSPPLAQMLAVGAMVLFFTVLTWAVRPYYWWNVLINTCPPLANRTGWISLAMLPFVMVFASKVNFITILTGTSHEKLQVFHRWSAWIMWVLALIHTIILIREAIKRGTMLSEWKAGPWYWTGVAALIPQTWLVVMSIGPIRNAYYETFKKLHFVAVGIFFPFLWVHCNFRQTSWWFIYAALGAWFVTWIVRVGRAIFLNGVNHRASIEAHSCNLIKIVIPTPSKVQWKPGEHYFIRFFGTGIHCLSSHPFTIASLATGEKSSLEAWIRVHEGITKRLQRKSLERNVTVPVVLDGPYGGLKGSLHVYDKVLLLAGGSGITFIMPILVDILSREKRASNTVQLVWAVASLDDFVMFEDTYARVQPSINNGSLTISCFVTRETFTPDTATTKDEQDKIPHDMETVIGRPDLKQLVFNFCSGSGTVGMTTCGPTAFTMDVNNAAATVQLDIARGRSKCTELYLHTEAYSW